MSYLFQPENAVPILSWYNSRADRELIKLIPLLEKLSEEKDVREHLPQFNVNHRIDYGKVGKYLKKDREQKRAVSEAKKKGEPESELTPTKRCWVALEPQQFE